MSLEALVSKYVEAAEKVVGELKRVQGPITVSEERVDSVMEYVSTYLRDAKYYKAQKRFETSLTSIAYCEGLLDALRLIGAVKFEWPAKPRNEE
jgi:hypothetical protein